MTNDTERQRVYSKRFYTKHKERVLFNAKVKRETNPSINPDALSKWRKNHPEMVNFQSAKRKWKDRIDVIRLLDGKCEKCGVTDPRILQVNHKNGNGREDRKLNGDRELYRAIKQGRVDIAKYNLLCANCNLLYDYEMGKRWIYMKFNADESYEFTKPKSV